MTYRRVLFRIPPEREDELMAQLWQQGTLGVESRANGEGALLVEAFFAGDTALEEWGGWGGWAGS